MANTADASKPAPFNLFNIGDSIGEGEAADGTIGATNHDAVWSTGYNLNDIVNSLNERFEDSDPTGYYENNAARDDTFNHAVSGSVMNDFKSQADAVVTAAGSTPSGKAGMVTILLGNNDVCAPSLETMTPPEEFESQYRAGLDILAASDATRNAYIHVTSIPSIYWLWNAMRGNNWCRLIWLFVPCENLLSNPINDCESGDSRLDPDTIYDNDGPNCKRRKEFHAKIRDIYNPILRDVLQEYADDGRLPNAYFADISDIQFEELHINDGDCFHPSKEGHALLAVTQWCRSPWRIGEPSCGLRLTAAWILLLLLNH
jgi:lysophospholipase L1-like esterase